MLSIEMRGLESLDALPSQIERGVRAGLKAVADDTRTHVAVELQKIDKEPIPTRAQVAAYRGKKGGKGSRSRAARQASSAPAWKRTGKLKESLKAEVTGDTGRVSVDTEYAHRREGLGRDWAPKEPALGKVRKNTFMDNTVERMKPKAQAIFEQEFENALRG